MDHIVWLTGVYLWRATLLLAVSSLAMSLSVVDTNGNVVSNSTVVTSVGQQPSFHCRGTNGSGTWTGPSGDPVPSTGPVVQRLNGSSSSLSFPGSFGSSLQGIYLCSRPTSLQAGGGAGEAYVGLFTSKQLAPQAVRVSLQSYPRVAVEWSPPEVGAAAVGMYQVVVVVPSGHAPLLQSRDTTSVQIEVATMAIDRYRLVVTVSAVYRFVLEQSRLERDIIPPPGNFTGKPISSSGSVELKWDRVSGSGVVLSGYDVTFGRLGGGAQQYKVVAVVGQTSAVIDRLEAGRYSFKVKANPSSSSALAFSSEAVVVEPFTVPSQPRAVMVTASSLTQVTVTWQPPEFAGGVPILRYFLSLGSFSVSVESDHAHSHTFSQLDPDGAYLLTVQARNAVGLGPGSAQREVYPRQAYQQARALPLEIIVPSAVGVLLLVLGLGSAIVFYTAVRKRKHRLRLLKSGDSHTGKQVDLSQSREEPPRRPEPQTTPVALRSSHTFNARAAASVPVPLRTAASFNVPRRNVITRLPDTDTMTTNTSYLRASQLHGFSVSTESLDNADYDSILPVPELPPPRPSVPQTSRREPRLKVRENLRSPQVPRLEATRVAEHDRPAIPMPYQTSRQDLYQTSRQDPHQTSREDLYQTSRQDPHQTSRQDLYQTSRQDPHQTSREDLYQTSRQDPHQTSRQALSQTSLQDPADQPPPLPPLKGVVGRSLSRESLESSCSSCYEDLDPSTLDPSDPGYARLHRPKHLYDSLRIPAANHTSSALCRSIEDMGTGSTSGSGRGSNSNNTGSDVIGADSGQPVQKPPPPPPMRPDQLPGNGSSQQQSLSRSEHYSLAAYSYEKPLPAKKPLLPPAPPPRT